MHKQFYTVQNLLAYVQQSKGGDKACCHLGALPAPIAQVVRAILEISPTEINLLIDSDGIRHALAQHRIAKSSTEMARGQITLVEADLLQLASWLQQPTAVHHGQAKPGKQPRVALRREALDGTTIASLEWRPGRQQLALVTMYKKGQLPK